MQIRLSVLAARDGAPSARAQARGRVPAQIADVLVTAPAGTTLGAVAGALAGAVGARPGPRGGRSAGQVLIFAGDQRLDERSVLGHPPLVDGVLLRLDEPDPDRVAGAESPDPLAELRVVGGPDAGGIHLLLPGRVRVGRSAEADVPLDDPDVSRFHLALDVSADGRIALADLGSTNGTALDGAPVGAEPCPVLPGALINLGESALLVVPGERRAPSRRTDQGGLLPDGQGHLQIAARPGTAVPPAPSTPGGPTASGTGSSPLGKPPGGRAKGLLARGGERLLRGRSGAAGRPAEAPAAPQPGRGAGGAARPATGQGPAEGTPGGADRGATPTHGVRLPAARPAAAVDAARWPDPAELLHTVLGPGPRLWERGPEHPDALALRLGSAGPGAAPAVLDLRAAGSLGLTGPRGRLAGLARALVAQLAALHGPGTLELVLVAADPARPAEARTEEWAWLHWLPQLRPTRGQSCRLLTAFDPEQALARLTELEATTTARPGGFTVLVVDGDPGGAEARAALGTLLAHGPARGGVHVIALAERPDLLPPGCGATAAITGEVGTLLTLERPLPHQLGAAPGGLHRAAPDRELVDGIALDAVSAAWAERLARALAPLREPDCTRRPGRGALPDTPGC
ncbi:FHA domain-containing protein [Streptacidiphilus sp. PAMC 29251]